MHWFGRKKTPEECINSIVNKYFRSAKSINLADYSKLEDCLAKLENRESPEYFGAMAYIHYREGNLNKMWDYIIRDLHLKGLGEEEHGAFIPAMMADIDPQIRYEILRKIYDHLHGQLSLQLMAKMAPSVGKEIEVTTLMREYLQEKNSFILRKMLKKLENR